MTTRRESSRRIPLATAHASPAMPSMPSVSAIEVRDKAESIRRGYLASPDAGDSLIARYAERLRNRGEMKAADFVMRQFGGSTVDS